MDSKEILRQTIEQPFNEQKFRQFIADFLNDYNVTQSSLTSFYPSFSEHINKFNLLGEYQDSQGKKLHILEVELKNTHKLESARTAQRNLVAKYLEDNWLDGALVGFWAPDSPHWRFSFVKLAWEFDKENKKTKKILSPAKRYSFLIGEGEPSHTAQFQLLPVLEQEKNPVLAQMEEAFSVERVTKEFYREYKQLFDKLYEELEKNRVFRGIKETKRIDTGNFAKKLLGQIVFLYFIQKKGWLGVPRDKKWGEGDRAFLRHLFERAKKEGKNFFNDYLEYLFYDTLNRKPELPGSFYRKYFDSQLPFLNGGLFEPMKGYDWEDSLLFLDNDLFSNAGGTGVLDVFDRYNFTVREDEPLEKEVAVDPEMLGKVFENLLEEILRKGKGTYYTPREIVHYMCRESLVNYLTSEHSNLTEENIRHYIECAEALSRDINELKEIWKGEWFKSGQFKELDDLLKNIKVVDPACGSGAFLVGMLQEVVKLRLFLQLTPDSELFSESSKDTIKEISEYQLKKETIQNCLYGVDIDPGAVEIAKLRLWLSLVVDYELEEIEPLPNLDYKVMQGNSLLEELVLGDTTIKLFDSNLIKRKGRKMKNLFEEEKQRDLFEKNSPVKKVMEQLDKLRKEYFKVSDLSEKLELRRQIEDIEQNLVRECIDREIKNLEGRIKNIGKYLAPGIGLTKEDAQKVAKIASLQDQIMQLWRELKESGVRPFFLWHLYFADVFQQKGGFDVIIGNPPYNAKLSETEKKLFKSKYESVRKGRQDTAAIFVERGGYLGNDSSTITYILPYRLFSRKRNHGQFQLYTLHNFSIDQVIYLGTNIGFTSSDEFMILMLKNKVDEDNRIEIVFKPRNIERPETFQTYTLAQLTWRGAGEINLNTVRFNQKILQKIRRDTVLLGHICEVKDGIVPFIREKLLSDYKKDNRYVKFVGIAGQYELEKYYLRYKDLYLCYDMEEAKKYIKDPKELSKVQLREESIFLHRKILTAQDSAKIKGTIDNEKLFVSNSLHSTFLKKEFENSFLLEYILALLNSKVINYFHDSLRLKGVDLHPQILISDLKKIAIKKTPKSQQKLFVSLVNEILSLTELSNYLQKEAQQKKVKEYENQIDKMVYKLYSLTPEEIKIIGNKT